MKLSIEHLLLMVVAFLVFVAFLPIEAAFSSNGNLALGNDHCLEVEAGEEDSRTRVTVFHQDEFGNDLLPACMISINEPGVLYIATNQNEALPEYDWMTTVGNAVGFHGEDDIEVIFIYRLRSLISITPDNRRASPGSVINYTLVITNGAAGIIEDSYTVYVHFDLRFSPVFRLEFTVDYLDRGDTVIHFSMPIHQSSLVGNKNVKAILIHPPAMIDIHDTEVLTQIEIIHQEAQPPASEVRPPTSQTPPANVPPTRPNEPEEEADNEEAVYSDYEVDGEIDNVDTEDELDSDQEEDDFTDNSDDFNVEEEEDLVEDVDTEDVDTEDADTEDEEDEQVEPTLSMIGTATYDVSILGAIIAVNFKNWRKMTVIRF